MDKKTLETKLKEIDSNIKRLEVLYHQMNGQKSLLEDLLKEEHSNKKEKNGSKT